MKNSLIISVIINIILVGFIYYNQLDVKKTKNKFQVLQYEIDSLSSIIYEKDTEICNLHTMETFYQKQISISRNELKNLSNKSKKYKKSDEA